jgi:pimeloyl-ACP methyl ester carboxylesterase
MHRTVEAGVLRVAYEEHGEPSGWPVVLLHGFPYDVRAYDEVAPVLAAAGARVIVPYLRGYGPTEFLDRKTPRCGQQAALGHDLRALLDALGIDRAILGGYDWGGRAACVCAALWPERVAGLVSVNGYNVQDIARANEPADPEKERRLWYQYYFHGERGRAGLQAKRGAVCRLLWSLWSPTWTFSDATYAATSASFANPDFVDVVIHSYRHRFALVAGDPALEPLEAALAKKPPITVATVTLEGADDGLFLEPEGAEHDAAQFTGPRQHRLVAGAGHNLPQEAPEAFAQAVIDLHAVV